MKNFLLSTAVLLFAGFAAYADDDKKAAPDGAKTAVSLDGTWKIVCLEKDGQAMPEAKGATVTAKGDMLTVSGKDDKPSKTMKVEFGDKGMVKVTETSGPDDAKGTMKSGVYVMSAEHLSICLHADGSAGDQSKVVIFLKREGTAKTGETQPETK